MQHFVCASFRPLPCPWKKNWVSQLVWKRLWFCVYYPGSRELGDLQLHWSPLRDIGGRLSNQKIGVHWTQCNLFIPSKWCRVEALTLGRCCCVVLVSANCCSVCHSLTGGYSSSPKNKIVSYGRRGHGGSSRRGSQFTLKKLSGGW